VPITTVPQTLIDLARATTVQGAGPAEAKLLRRALGVLDYRGELDVEALLALCHGGPPGSVALRAAIAAHQPGFARANEGLEERFLELCLEWKLPLPRVNVWLHGELVDAYWPEHALVVELDGGHHARPAQLRRDRARDLLLRRHGISVVRYDWDLVTQHPSETRADLVGQLGARRNSQPA
jgi:very-short-patch-repair endonuclease